MSDVGSPKVELSIKIEAEKRQEMGAQVMRPGDSIEFAIRFVFPRGFKKMMIEPQELCDAVTEAASIWWVNELKKLEK